MTSKCTLVIGTPGSGKSFLLKHVKKSSDIEVVNYGKMMLKVAGFSENQRDRLRKMPHDEQMKNGEKAAHEIARLGDRPILIDTHAMIQSPKGYVPGIPETILKILNPKCICIIVAEPKVILERRKNDPKRSRDLDSLEKIALHQEINLAFATTCSVITGSILKIIHNNHDIEKAVQALLEIL